MTQDRHEGREPRSDRDRSETNLSASGRGEAPRPAGDTGGDIPQSDEADQSHVFNQGYGTGYGGMNGEGGYGADPRPEKDDERR